jgi:23S rRNA (pseudouridine1915-N3)-methyltransferase
MTLKVVINAIGKITEREIISLNQEYIKRIKWEIAVNELQPARLGNESKNKEKEAESLWPSNTNNAYVIALDETGKQFTSEEFSQKLSQLESNGTGKIYFLIGGADGHTQTTRDKADLIISLGKMTLPHKLARLILIEQIYRAYSISSGHPYHR